MFKTPSELLKAYKDGFNGSWCDQEDVAKLLGELPHPLFGASAYNLSGTGEGKLALLFKSIMKHDPDFGRSERQVQGDCVSHATRNSVDITRCCEIIGGEREEFVAKGATEAIYGSRGFGGEGMSCSAAARFVHQTGGILLRQKYGDIDLSEYSAIGGKWGSRGVPEELVIQAKKHQVKTISLVNTVAQARDALANGYSISVCSNSGFSSRRDKHGIAKRSGNWGHAMAWVGMDDTREIHNETLFLVQNSWGVWNGGDKRHDQPDGSFWIRQSDAEEMLAANGSWVFSDVNGFPARKITWTINEVF
jgi:hypothetical protein